MTERQVITAPRWHGAWLVCIGASITAVGVLFLSGAVAVVAVIVAALFALVGLSDAMWPRQLALTADEFVVRFLGGRWLPPTRWADVGEFRLKKSGLGLRRSTTSVVYDDTNGPGRLETFGRDPNELVGLLNRYRDAARRPDKAG